MNWESYKINNNNSNNGNCGTSFYIRDTYYQHLDRDMEYADSIKRDLETDVIEVAETGVTKVESVIDKVTFHEQNASRELLHHESDGKDDQSDADTTRSYESNPKMKETEDEEPDELDGSRRARSHVVSMEEFEEQVTKKTNTYAAKKTVAQGMMDIALITANANQLRYLIEFNRNSSTFAFISALIIMSLSLQLFVGIALIFKGRLDIKGKSKHSDAKRINNYVVVAIFLVTIINVFIASFTITGEQNARTE